MIFFEACSQDPLAHSIAEDFDKANPNQKMRTLFILFTFILFYDAASLSAVCAFLLSLLCCCVVCCVFH